MPSIKPTQPAAHTPNHAGEWHSLQEHLRDVAAKAKAYAAKLRADELGYYAGLWHDLGKYQLDFQRYLEQCHAASELETDKPPRGVPHAIHGARLAMELCPILAPIIYGHHVGIPGIEVRQKLAQPELIESYEEVIQQAAQALVDLRPPINLQDTLQNPPRNPYSGELFIRMLFSCLVDADYLDTEEHFEPYKAQSRGSKITIAELWPTFEKAQSQLLDNLSKAGDSSTQVNRIRAEVYKACLQTAALEPGIFRLAVPTGGGKTRSGLGFALHHAMQHGLERIVVAVPYTSIIEQTVQVYRQIFGDEAVLEHHSAIRVHFDHEKDARSEDAQRSEAQARLATQNWDVPLVVTTTVQLFESLFANRPSRCRKLHNLVGSVIVLDEVQTLPIGLLKPIVSVLRELVQRYRVTVILCTATQPALEENSRYFEGFEPGSVKDIILPERAKAHFRELSRVVYEPSVQGWSWRQLAEDIQENSQALVILNTRKDALSVLDALGTLTSEFQAITSPQLAVREALAQQQILHLSTLLCGAHRREVLETVKMRLKNNQSCLLISTQVVEAGVDIDFPVVYRALGPLDRIVQAAGRCNREGKMQGKGRVVIFEPVEGGMPKDEYATAVATTKRFLQQPGLDLHDPAIFEMYFQNLYQGVSSDKHDIQGLREKSNYPEVAARFRLIEDNTTPVVIQYDEQVHGLLSQIRRRGLFSSDRRQLQPYIVNLRQREFEQAEEREEVAPGLWVWRGGYDPIRGIAVGNAPAAYEPTDLIQ